MIIDIVIPTYNRSESLKRTAQSLFTAHPSDKINFNLYIVDNNSTDRTKTVIEELNNEFKGNIHYLFEPQQGMDMAKNSALKAAKGDVLIFTDDDVTFGPGWLKSISENFKNPAVHCLTGKIIPVYNHEKPSWYSDKLSCVIGYVDYGEQRTTVDHATGANTALRRETFQKLGGFTARKDLINEDTFLSQKLLLSGYEIIYDPRMVICHHFQKEKFTKPYFRKWYWKSGRSISVLNFQKDRQYKQFIGIPLWRFRQSIEHTAKMIIHMFNKPLCFYHELQLRRFFGFCYQRWFRQHP